MGLGENTARSLIDRGICRSTHRRRWWKSSAVHRGGAIALLVAYARRELDRDRRDSSLNAGRDLSGAGRRPLADNSCDLAILGRAELLSDLDRLRGRKCI